MILRLERLSSLKMYPYALRFSSVTNSKIASNFALPLRDIHHCVHFGLSHVEFEDRIRYVSGCPSPGLAVNLLAHQLNLDLEDVHGFGIVATNV